MCSVRLHQNRLVSMVVWLLLLGAIGCDSKPAPPAKPTERGPKEKFALVVSAVKHELEGTTSLGFGSRSNESAAQNTQRTVREELIEPTDTSPTYMGRITVETKTTYSSASRPPENVEPVEEETKPKGLFDSLDDEDSPDGLLGLNGSENAPLVGRSPKSRSDRTPGSSSDSVVVRGFENEWTKTFDLAYEEGHWVLKTEVEDDGIRAVFEAALKKQ